MIDFCPRWDAAMTTLEESHRTPSDLLGCHRSMLWLDKILDAAMGAGPRGDIDFDVAAAIREALLEAAEQPQREGRVEA